jgi:hypothetical protein
MYMNAPITKKPSKKTFHFPKNSTAAAPEEDKSAAAPVETKPVEAKPATKKSAAKKSAAKKSAAKKPAAKKPAAKEPAGTSKSAKSKRAVAAEAAPASAPVQAKAKRAKKDKVVRDSFTMPKSDYDKIATLKKICLEAGVSVKKSELLRAGLLMLESAAPKRLLAAVSSVEAVKTGRPAQE